MQVVTDPADPRLDDFRDLSDADVRPDRRGVVIAEGVQRRGAVGGLALPVRAVIGVPARIEALRPVLEPAATSRCTSRTSGCCRRWSVSA